MNIVFNASSLFLNNPQLFPRIDLHVEHTTHVTLSSIDRSSQSSQNRTRIISTNPRINNSSYYQLTIGSTCGFRSPMALENREGRHNPGLSSTHDLRCDLELRQTTDPGGFTYRERFTHREMCKKKDVYIIYKKNKYITIKTCA